VSYVGNNGKKLLFTQYYEHGAGNPLFTNLEITSNGAQSSYNAFQIQDKGRIAPGLDMVGSFTWSHALDNSSSDISLAAPIHGNSNYDLRRVLNLALNYQSPAIGKKEWINKLARGWDVAGRFATQSGYPFNVIESTIYLPSGPETQFLPNLVPGVPLYLHGSAADLNGIPALGNWRLNRAAFACTTTGATSGTCTGTPSVQGTLGRNYLRQPPFWALNTSIQREFPLYEQLHLNFRADAFNILNHPNPNVINTTLSSTAFGEDSTGLVGTIGSNNSFYSMGSARSLQFSLKLQF
jgi:hypothetical protein